MKPLEIAAQALACVRTRDGSTHLCLWRDRALWDLHPLSLDDLLRLPLAEIRKTLDSVPTRQRADPKVELVAPA